jgi:inositol transport system ATP-binding protein
MRNDNMSANEFVLQMKNISKNFPGVKALKNVSIDVRKGTVHAFMGENGAGKSTLMKILTGIYCADEGEIYLNGKLVQINNPHQAITLGISMIHQELSPVLEMKVSDNIFLGREPVNKITGLVDAKKINEDTQKLFETLNIKGTSPQKKMKDLSIAQMQMVEIVKAVSQNANLIIMDEPTSAITETEVNTLFKIIELLKEKGISIIYISHKMDEIFTIADEVTVLRDGEYVGTDNIKNITKEKLISMMVGRNLTNLYPKRKVNMGEVVFEARHLNKAGLFKDISFELHKGEILGIGGLMGAGRTEIMESIIGLRNLDSGEIYKDGLKLVIKNPHDAIMNKIALAPEDRKLLGLFLCHSIKQNISISNLDMISKMCFIDGKSENVQCGQFLESLRIKAKKLATIVNNLSGGNQQKVVLAKWLFTSPDILILDEPTRGIDVGAKAEIYNIIGQLVENGKSVILVSSEMPELISLSDRIIVLHEGVITGELKGEKIEQEKIMRLASS